MRNYDRVSAHVPEGIEDRLAHIVGGGIAGLSAAAFLIVDGHMPAGNITIYEQLPVSGGSMDGAGNAADGYVSRGERELEPYMECLWYLCSLIPSASEPGRTVLEETRDANLRVPINSQYRLTERQFQKTDYNLTGLGLTAKDQEALFRMVATSEDELGDITIGEFFPRSFFSSNLWYFWASMLAFQEYHSLIEMRRYAIRFVQHLPGISHLRGILHTKYNQYDSIIAPLASWLAEQGVITRHNAEVTDLDLQLGEGAGAEKTVTALRVTIDDEETVIPIAANDVVLVTNGSMTQNSARGSMTEAAPFNDDALERGCFSLWERLAQKSPEFGNPARFISTPEQSFFVSWTLTITDYPELVDYIVDRTGNIPGSGGAITMVDSAWFQTWHVPEQPLYPDQPDNVQVFWGYGLHGWKNGDYIGKPMSDATGEEILKEFLYHAGLSDRIDEILPHSVLIPTMMPYITSQFMPRTKSDRPLVIPEGSRNLGFIGQFVEVPDDVVFTVETSVRTAMTAVYGLLDLDKPVTPIYQGIYDARIALAITKTALGTDELSIRSLPHLNPFKVPEAIGQALKMLGEIPALTEHDIVY